MPGFLTMDIVHVWYAFVRQGCVKTVELGGWGVCPKLGVKWD